jgi:hypothetical protein
MTTARIIIGEAFIAVLALAIIYAAVAPTLQPLAFPQIQIPWLPTEGNMENETYTLIKGTNVSQNTNFVNLNITIKFGGIYIVFSDSTNLAFEVLFQHTSNATDLQASYSQNGQNLQVNAYGETGGLNITLGRSCQYNGTLDIRIGALLMTLGQNTNISRFAVDIRYAGGIALTINSGASFEQLDLDTDIGGLQLNVQATSLGRSGTINTRINIGGLSMGVDVNTSLVGVSFDATVDVGTLTVDQTGFIGSVSSTHCSVHTGGYSDAINKLEVKANVGLGGITLQRTIQSFPGFQA